MSSTKKKGNEGSKTIRSPKADELMETYRELGFVPLETANVASATGGDWLAPVSFLPHVDYTISSVVGGY